MAIRKYHIQKDAVDSEQIRADAVGSSEIENNAVDRAELKCIKFGTVTITPPSGDELPAQSTATKDVAVSEVKTTDLIYVFAYGTTVQATAIPVAAYCPSDGTLRVQFANITTGTAVAEEKTFGYVRFVFE